MSPQRAERPDDLSIARPPENPRFDPQLDAWALSRYADVMAALQDFRLQPIGYSKADVQTGFPPARLKEWQARLEPLADKIIDGLPAARKLDLVREFAEPWCAALACLVTGADPADQRLLKFARQVSARAADPHDTNSKAAATSANRELERTMPSGIPMAAPTFVALAQTLPAFLANAWLALLRHRAELSRLRAHPEIMSGAVEELLRYAGLARVLFRRAATSIRFGEVTMAPGQCVALLLFSANRDPARFPNPNRLDLTRRAVGHLAFGTGPHSCVGASLIRMAAAIATSAFVRRFQNVQLCDPVDWRGSGAGFRAPVALYVRPTRLDQGMESRASESD